MTAVAEGFSDMIEATGWMQNSTKEAMNIKKPKLHSRKRSKRRMPWGTGVYWSDDYLVQRERERAVANRCLQKISERSPVLLRHEWWHQATIRVWVLALLWKPSANQLNYFITTCKLWRSNTPCAINSLGPYSGTWYSIMYPQRGCWQVETSIHNSRGRRLCSQLLPVPSLGVGKFLLAFHIMHHQCCCPEAKSLPT